MCMYVPVQVKIVLFVYMAYLLAQASTTDLGTAAHETTSTGLLHLLLQLRQPLTILPMATIFAIPMHFLAFAAAVAEGAAGAAKLALLALKLGTASTAGVPELAELATEVEQINKSFLSFLGRGERHIRDLAQARFWAGRVKIADMSFSDCYIDERNALNGLIILRSNSVLRVVMVSVLEKTFRMVNSSEMKMS